MSESDRVAALDCPNPYPPVSAAKQSRATNVFRIRNRQTRRPHRYIAVIRRRRRQVGWEREYH